MAKRTYTAITYQFPAGITTHTWTSKTQSTISGTFDRIDPKDDYPEECYSITAHYDHATDDVSTVVLNSCNHVYADNSFRAQREAIKVELIARVAAAFLAATLAVSDDATVTARAMDSVRAKYGATPAPAPGPAQGTCDELRSLLTKIVNRANRPHYAGSTSIMVQSVPAELLRQANDLLGLNVKHAGV